ncbi:MAG TPA: UTP--glucose-1-phosphate uridylyltransferase GalU [Dongiaceae bacterium]|jgi:UTP--glucose-1-phosphate uridylyltransferase
MQKPLRKAVFPVGGLGTRFLPATKSMPKEMLTVVDKPLIQYAVDEARAAGIEELIFVTGRGKAALEDHFDYAYELHDTLKSRGKTSDLKLVESLLLKPGSIAYTRQQEPRGLGHAVWCARHLIEGEPFAVLLADDLVQSRTPCLKQMVDEYNKTGGNLVAVMDVPREHTNRYGILKTGAEKGQSVEVKGLVEKPKPEEAPSTLSIIGRYILQPEIMDHLAAQEVGAGGEVQLTDAMAKMIGKSPFHGFRFEGRRFDCGDKAGFVEANIAFALEHPATGKAVKESVLAFAANLKG